MSERFSHENDGPRGHLGATLGAARVCRRRRCYASSRAPASLRLTPPLPTAVRTSSPSGDGSRPSARTEARAFDIARSRSAPASVSDRGHVRHLHQERFLDALHSGLGQQLSQLGEGGLVARCLRCNRRPYTSREVDVAERLLWCTARLTLRVCDVRSILSREKIGIPLILALGAPSKV